MISRSETDLQREIQLAVGETARLFRNQTGSYRLADGRWLRSGLCTGSSDLIGWLPYTITTGDIGRRCAVFFAVECKSVHGRLTPEQSAFLDTVRRSGGIAVVARETGDVTQVIRSWQP